MSYAKGAELLHLARFVAGQGATGVTLGDVEARFGCDRRRGQRMLAALARLMPDLTRTIGGDRRPRWRLAAAAIAPLSPPPAEPSVPAARAGSTRELLIETTKRLMVEEGYGAVSTRSVARRAGLTPASVHYHFPTTDDLLIAVYHQSAAQNADRLAAVLAGPAPLHALWRASGESVSMGLAAEFIALANHRKAIGGEIARAAQVVRAEQAAALMPLLVRAGIDPEVCRPLALVVLLTAVARALVMEEGVGIRLGHDDARGAMAWLLARLEPA